MVIIFSSKQGGNSESVAGFIKKELPDTDIICFPHLSIKSCSFCGYECFVTDCPHKDGNRKLYDTILKANLVIFIVPNYCDYPPSSFFIFNERGCDYFGKNGQESLKEYLGIKKKFIIISNSDDANIQKALTYHINEGEILNSITLSSKAYGLKSIDGNLLMNNAALKTIKEFIHEK